ncbi:MAG: hypothetical protein NTZ67_01185 [Gammaproteobacteria bacterium]|nr:hypothetical protein [Gammaproteobacteria bacterium]
MKKLLIALTAVAVLGAASVGMGACKSYNFYYSSQHAKNKYTYQVFDNNGAFNQPVNKNHPQLNVSAQTMQAYQDGHIHVYQNLKSAGPNANANAGCTYRVGSGVVGILSSYSGPNGGNFCPTLTSQFLQSNGVCKIALPSS